MVTSSTSLAALIRQVASNPASVLSPKSEVTSYASENHDDLSKQTGFAGVQRRVGDDRYVGSGLHLSLSLSSGQDISLTIEKSLSGGVKDIRLDTKGELSAEDEERLTQFLTKLSDSVEALFSATAAHGGLFDFTNMSGVKDIAFEIQQDKGNIKQKLEFEKHHTQYGRKEVEGEWSRYDRLSGDKEQHNFALSKQPREAMAAYGQMDYQWVVDQVKAGMNILGNAHTGDASTQSRVTHLFVSAIHSLFNESQKGHALLQEVGASAQDAKALIGKTIRVLSDRSEDRNNMPGSLLTKGEENKKNMNGLADFKADFSSKREASNSIVGHGEYDLSMSISQISRMFQGATEEDSSQTQIRRMLLEYESEGAKQKYDYTWEHNEMLIYRYKQGSIDSTYYKLMDQQQGILSTQASKRNESSHYMERREYKAEDNQQPALKNRYVKPSIYTEQNGKVHYSV